MGQASAGPAMGSGGRCRTSGHNASCLPLPGAGRKGWARSGTPLPVCLRPAVPRRCYGAMVVALRRSGATAPGRHTAAPLCRA